MCIDQYLNKCSHPVKFGQLVEYNMTNIFLEKLYAKCGGDTIPRPFSQKSVIEHIPVSIV